MADGLTEQEVAFYEAVKELVRDVPWASLRNEERDGMWADYSAFESWLMSKMPEHAATGYEEAEDTGAWKPNLYAVFSKTLTDEINRTARSRLSG